jgi:hypothetical protein
MAENYERVRHLKRGIEADVLGEAEVQIAKPKHDVFAPRPYSEIREGDKLTIYQHDGKLWARFTDEFRDGRFETITEASTTDGERYRPASTAFPPEVKEHLARRVKAIEAAWNSPEHEHPEPGQVTFLLRLANAYLDLPEVQPAAQERAEICRVLGCVDKPGVPLKFVEDLNKRVSDQWARINELLRSWDKATPTERQELDRLRRGWGPSTPTEREQRRANVASAIQALSIAMSDVSVPEDEADEIPKEAHDRLDEAHDRLGHAHTSLMAVLKEITADPQEWPDIRAAEERGAAAMRQVLLEMVSGMKIIETPMLECWRFENVGIARAESAIKRAPWPHDYHGSARAEVQAILKPQPKKVEGEV